MFGAVMFSLGFITGMFTLCVVACIYVDGGKR